MKTWCATDKTLERIQSMMKFHDVRDQISKIAGFCGMVISITVAFYLIFPTGQTQSKFAMLLVSFGIGIALSVLTFKALLKSQR